MQNANEFMLVFRYTPNFNYQTSEEDRAEMKKQWGDFIGNVLMQEKLVSTHQLGFEGKQISADLSTQDQIVVADERTLGGNMIVRTHSIEEAAEIAKGSPILKMGGTVEVRNILPMS